MYPLALEQLVGVRLVALLLVLQAHLYEVKM
jgi:hypothetical protein